MCRFYGLKPWEVDELWPVEIDEFLRQYQQYVRELERR